MKNLVFIAIDTCRQDHLSCYGYSKITSPNIDHDLANQGTLFLNHFAPSNCTLPGYTTMFTGLHPISHDIIAHNPQWPMAPHVKMLAEILKKKGYYNAQVSTLIEMPCHVDHLKRGFDEWEFDSHQFKAKFGDQFPPEQYQGGHVVSAMRIQLQAIDILNRVAKQFHENNVRDPEYITALYDGQIAYADHSVGVILKCMHELKLDPSTAVMITSDHGETLDEPNNAIIGTKCMYSHIGLTDPNIRIPLIFKGPEISKGKIADFTQHVDLMPTILDYLGFAGTPGSPNFSLLKEISYTFDGSSLYPRILGKQTFIPTFSCELGDSPVDPSIIHNQSPRKAILLLENTYQKFRAIRTQRWKFIKKLEPQPELRSMPEYQLYDLHQDPREFQNIADLSPQICRVLNDLMESWVVALCHKHHKTDPQLKYPTTLSIWRDQTEYKYLSENADRNLIIDESAEK